MKNKLLNFTICQIFIVIGMSVSCVNCDEQQKLPAAENVTHFDRSFHKLLSRRKRFLLWRPGSNVLLTASLVKPLVFPGPGGHNLILEWDIFYPLPSSWYLPEKTTKPPVTTAAPVTDALLSFQDHSGEIWMPSAGWSSDTDVIGAISDSSSDKRRFWDAPQQLRRNDVIHNFQLKSPVPSPASQYRNSFLTNQPWQQMPQTNAEINFNQQFYQSNRHLPYSSPTSYSERNIMTNNKRQVSNMPKGRSLETLKEHQKLVGNEKEESTNANWKYHKAHRDRRDLFSRFEAASPLSSMDVKSCLLRAICESQHFLNPPGYSLLQDALRLIFTVPIKDDMDDDYSNAMRVNDQDCVRIYSEKCPISILTFILQAKL